MPAGRAARPATALVFALLVAGCGGGPSKQEYVERGDAICQATSDQQAALTVPPANDVEALAGYYEASADLLARQFDQLDRLDKPADDEERLDDVYDRARQAVRALRDAAAAVRTRDEQTAADAVSAAQTQLGDIQAALATYGFSACAS